MPEAGTEEEALDSDPQRLGPRGPAAKEGGAGVGAESEAGAEVWQSCLVVEGREVRRADVGSLLKATTRSLSKRSAGVLFDWLLAPLPRDAFYADVWERRPLLIRRPNARCLRRSNPGAHPHLASPGMEGPCSSTRPRPSWLTWQED